MSPGQGGAPPGTEGATTRGRPAATPLAAAVLAALVLATFLAVFFAQELKRRPALLLHPLGGTITLQPLGAITQPHVHHYAHLWVRVSVRSLVTVSIRSVRSGRTVWTFAPHELRRYHRAYLTWEGRTAHGRLAPGGEYRVVVHFATGQTVEPLLTLRLVGPRA